MKRVLVIALLALTVPAAAAEARTYLGGCIASPEPATYKPKRIVIGCGSGTNQIRRVRWSRWGAHNARGHGRAWINACNPTCVEDRIRRYPVRLRAFRARRCSVGPRRQFRRLRLT